jgi:peroxiredoxin
MSLVESNMLPIGTKAPSFELMDTTSGHKLSIGDVKGEKGLVVLFICNHCPYVIHVNSELVKIANEYRAKGVGFVAISSNDVENYPEDSPDKMAIVAKVLQYPFPYLYDETQEVARVYDAACTPDIYVFNKDLNLYYRGRLDASRPGNNIPLNGEDLRGALNDMLSQKEAPSLQYPSAGCNIKWKKQVLLDKL